MDITVPTVPTELGSIACEYVVNCGGMWARELGKMAGVNVPLHAAEHYYLITEDMPGIHRDLPIVEDPDLYTYFRDEGGGLMLGMFEPIAAPWGMNGIPKDFSFDELPPEQVEGDTVAIIDISVSVDVDDPDGNLQSVVVNHRHA